MNDIFLTKLGDNPKENFLSLFKKFEIKKNLKNICIKPNLNEYRRWETASTCDPQLLDALLEIIREKYPDASISLLESDQTGVNADNIFSFLGVDVIAKKHNCNCINVARQKWNTIEIDGYHFKQFDIPSILSDCDLFITFPKIKSHIKTKITCGLKNQMGLFKPKRKVEYHHILNELIVDCNLAMKPSLSIADANLVMEGNFGPSYGNPRKLGFLAASEDVVAIDSFAAKLFGFKPSSIAHIKMASKKKLGSMKFHIIADFDFKFKNYKLKFNPFMHYIINKMSKSLKN